MESDPNANYTNNSSNNDSSYMYSLNNNLQEMTSYYHHNLIDAFQNLREEDIDLFNGQDFDNQTNENDSSCNRNNSNTSNTINNQETSTINSNDLALEGSFEFLNNDMKKDSLKLSKEEPSLQRFIVHKRIQSAPLRLLNEFEEFKYSSQYINLEKAFQYANKLIMIRSDGRFDFESEEGNKISHKFLRQIEALIHSLNIKGYSRDYRKNFSKAYIFLFEENSLCYLTEILESAQEANPFLLVNGEKFTFSREVLDIGNQLFNSFYSLIILLTDSVNKIREELFFDNIKELKNDLKTGLLDFDKKWVLYEEKYINELINIEKASRRFILEGIEIEKEITRYETRANIKGKLIIKDNEYNKLLEKFINQIIELNKVANIEGKGRDDLTINILLKAEYVICTVSDGKSKGMRNLAISIKNSLLQMRLLFRKFEETLETIDPQLRNNQDLSDKLYEFESKWERGKEYLLDDKKYSQLLFFSQSIEILCEKYNKYSMKDLIEERDPSIFVSLPCILLLKSIDNEDEGICSEYIPNLYNSNEESGMLYDFLKKIRKELSDKMENKYTAYNLCEKLMLFDGMKEEENIERELLKYINNEVLLEFKTSAINLSVHLQRYKPCEWNMFFELAMNIK